MGFVRLILLSLLMPISVWSAETSTEPRGRLEICQEMRAQPPAELAVHAYGTFEEVTQKVCRTEFEENGCAALLLQNPSLQGKIKNCDFPQQCATPLSMKEFGKVCYASFKDSWMDLAKGIAGFLFGNQSLSETLKKREVFFNSCNTTACKYEMLGPFASMFTKTEIEGAEDKSKLDTRDPVLQNARNGLSAATLYRKLLLKLKAQNDHGLLKDKFIEPWSGQAAKLPRSFEELMSSMLTKMGVTHSACFDPAVVAEMRCYAFFSVLDPTVLMSGAIKIASLSGRTVNLERLLAKQIAEMRPPSVPITVYSEALEQKMKRVKLIADRKKFDQDFSVEMVSNKIGAGRKEINYRDKNVALNAETLRDGDKFIVTVNSVEANPGVANFLNVTVAARESGLNSTFAKTFYSTIKGAALAAKANPGIKVIRINASLVINGGLKRSLSEMGFVSGKTHLPLTETQIADKSGQSLFFELPAEKLSELGY
jgi:hypothetical protein